MGVSIVLLSDASPNIIRLVSISSCDGVIVDVGGGRLSFRAFVVDLFFFSHFSILLVVDVSTTTTLVYHYESVTKCTPLIGRRSMTLKL